jgi:Protein of unknown function (DUF2281)
MSIVEQLVEKLNVLPPEKQQELLAFADALVQETEVEARPRKGAWRNHPAVGLWKDRADMADSVEWVRKLRREQWERSSE